MIVLLILAGVAVATLTGDNGLLTKAGEAKEINELLIWYRKQKRTSEIGLELLQKAKQPLIMLMDNTICPLLMTTLFKLELLPNLNSFSTTNTTMK